MNLLRFLRRLAVTSLLVVALSGAGHLILSPAAAATGPAAQAVVALTEGTATADDIPTSFEEVMGYRPVVTDGVLVKPAGGCSTPAGLDHSAFRDPCRVHDLGYDLLRYAESTDEPLGPWARLAIDRRFHRDLDGTCGSVGCRLLARVYGFGVGLNSVRQGFTVPVPEPGGPWLAVVGAMIAVAWMPARRGLSSPRGGGAPKGRKGQQLARNLSTPAVRRSQPPSPLPPQSLRQGISPHRGEIPR